MLSLRSLGVPTVALLLPVVWNVVWASPTENRISHQIPQRPVRPFSTSRSRMAQKASELQMLPQSRIVWRTQRKALQEQPQNNTRFQYPLLTPKVMATVKKRNLLCTPEDMRQLKTFFATPLNSAHPAPSALQTAPNPAK